MANVYSTIIYTKSGNKIFVAGRQNDTEQRLQVGHQLIKYYDRNFTSDEQKQIGNIFYDMYDRYHQSIRPKEPAARKMIYATSGTFSDEISKRCNPNHDKMVDLWIEKKYRNNEHIITHELIHAKQHMTHNKPKKDLERKTEFESVGRMSRHGVLNLNHGYYFAPNQNNRQIRTNGDLTKKEKITAIREKGVYHDRRLLTGSLSRQIIGKPIEKRVSRLFRKSYFINKME